MHSHLHPSMESPPRSSPPTSYPSTCQPSRATPATSRSTSSAGDKTASPSSPPEVTSISSAEQPSSPSSSPRTPLPPAPPAHLHHHPRYRQHHPRPNPPHRRHPCQRPRRCRNRFAGRHQPQRPGLIRPHHQLTQPSRLRYTWSAGGWMIAAARAQASSGGGKSELRRAVCRITSGTAASRRLDGQCNREDTALRSRKRPKGKGEKVR